MSGARRTPKARLARAGLAVASVGYAGAMRLRRWAYRRGLMPATAVDAPVICVGNLTTGGTGKTPMVAWLVEHLKQIGRRPAILSRGYKSEAGKSDEADLLAQLSQVDVVVNPDRIAAARSAIEAGADVLVMDDGFQHRRLNRDLDIVLIDATNPFGYGYCLPRGLMREPPSALAEAAVVVMTRADRVSAEALAALAEKLGNLAPDAPLCRAIHQPVAVIDEQARRLDTSALAGRSVFAFCGIANPAPFFAGLSDLRANLAGSVALEDHVRYTPDRVEQVNRLAADCAAQLLVTTQKDATKLAGADFTLPVWSLAVRMAITDGRAELIAAIERAVC